jgi:hypothetical protein
MLIWGPDALSGRPHAMQIAFEGEIFIWRGPAPFFFVAVPDDDSQFIKSFSAQLTYGWGVIPADVIIGKTAFYTALLPKDGRYLVPLKDKVRQAEQLDAGDVVQVRFTLRER